MAVDALSKYLKYLQEPQKYGPGAISAALLAAQFQNWQANFKPIELQAIDQISFNNPEVMTQALGKAQGAVESAYSAMPGILERQNEALGIAPTQQQAATSRRLMDYNKALSTVAASNQARANIRAEDEQLLMGVSPNPNIVRPMAS